MPHIKRVARFRQISEPEAREFCLRVQRCFSGRVPRYNLIADAVEQQPDGTPEEIADVVRIALRYKANTRERESCKHGVPVGMKCALCNPEGFMVSH